MKLLEMYWAAGCRGAAEVLAMAATRGPVALAEARAALDEVGRQHSLAMVLVPGQPPGRELCAYIRQQAAGRSRIIVAAIEAGLQPGAFEEMLRVSLPDVETRLRVMDVSPSISSAIEEAESLQHYRAGQALEVYADDRLVGQFEKESSEGEVDFDPTVISVIPTDIPSDDQEGIRQALETDEVSAIRQWLDPHLISSEEGMMRYRAASGLTEGVIDEMATFSAASVIPTLVDMELVPLGTREEIGEGHYGMVFPSEDPSRVVKVTEHREEADNARKMVGRNLPGIARVFAVHDLSQGFKTVRGNPLRLWVIELERLEPLDPAMLEQLGDLDDDLQRDYLRSHDREGFGEYVTRPEVLSRIEKIAPGVSKIVRSATALGFNPDLHAGNIMRTADGQLVLADLGPLPGEMGKTQPWSKPQGGTKFQRDNLARPSGGRQVNELVGTQAAPQAGPQSQMRASNSSAWSGGRLVLKKPEQHVPTDDNESERDRALDQDIVGGGLDWGIGLNKRGY